MVKLRDTHRTYMQHRLKHWRNAKNSTYVYVAATLASYAYVWVASESSTREEMGHATEKSPRNVTITAYNTSVTESLFHCFKNAVSLIGLETGENEINDRLKGDF